VGADVVKASRKLDSVEAAALMRQIGADPNVEYVEVDKLNKPLFTPNDPRYSEQWSYYETTAGLNLPAAWDKSTGSGVVVAVLDTGITPHSELNANVIAGYDFISDTAVSVDGDGRDSNPNDPGDGYNAGECGTGVPASNSSWHGTHVAGTIAAVTNNGSGVSGVAYNAKVEPVRVLGKCGGYDSDIADAMVWASGGTVSGVPANPNPAEVINLSLGGSGACSATTQNAINGAVGRGTTIVIAAGNDNANVSGYSPGNCANIVSVAAVGRNGQRASYSNYGSMIDVAAPGGSNDGIAADNILSTINTGARTQGAEGYAFYAGTSMATPHVAGVVALMQAVAPTPKTPSEIESLLKSTARAFPVTPNQTIGAGIVDAAAAVNAAAGTTPPPPGGTLTKGVAITNQSASTGNALNYTMSVPSGASNLTFTMSGGTGDGDLYVKYGSAPTDTSYDCRPYLTGNAETCTFATPSAGTYYVRIKAYSSFSGVSILGDYTTGSSCGGTVLCSGVGVALPAVSTGGVSSNYTLSVPSGKTSVVFTISGGTGDADMYVKLGSAPTSTSYSCRPYLTGNSETCTFNAPTAGTYYVNVRAYSSYSGVTLKGTIN
jgi:serine protease